MNDEYDENEYYDSDSDLDDADFDILTNMLIQK